MSVNVCLFRIMKSDDHDKLSSVLNSQVKEFLFITVITVYDQQPLSERLKRRLFALGSGLLLTVLDIHVMHYIYYGRRPIETQ